MAEMNTMLQRDVPGATFEPWDWWYYAEKVRKDKYALDDATLRPYFSLEKCSGRRFFRWRTGFTGLRSVRWSHRFTTRIARYMRCSTWTGLIWACSISTFFRAAAKSSGAWCTAFRSQRYEGDERIAPVVAIVCNFTPPTKLTPSLLTLDEVQTLFHEFGHGLHALFAEREISVASGRVEGDFVELPSQIMENWATEPEVLRHYAINYTTGRGDSRTLDQAHPRKRQVQPGLHCHRTGSCRSYRYGYSRYYGVRTFRCERVRSRCRVRVAGD